MLADDLQQCGAIQFGEFTLSSGKKSSFYVNIKKASGQPAILKTIAREMAKRIGDTPVDAIAGMELGAVPIAVALSLEIGVPHLIIRKAAKTYGTGSQIEGDVKPGDHVVVVEDVTTTGGSALRSVAHLREAGATVNTVFTVVDREEGAAPKFSAVGVDLVPLVKMSELLKKS